MRHREIWRTIGHKFIHLDSGMVAAWLLAIGYGGGFSILALLRHWAFNTHAFDLGLYHQVVWNTHAGEWFRFTYWLGFKPDLINFLGDHVSLVLWPISWMYWLHDGPETLLILQAFVMGSGVVPLYLVGRRWGCGRFASVAMASLYLLHPALQAITLFDFHPEVLAAPLLLWAFEFAERRQYWGFWITLVLVLMCKENLALTVVPFGLYWATRRPQRVTGLAAVAVGISWFALCFFVIQPWFNPGTGSNYVVRYSAYGDSWSEIALRLVTSPTILWRVLTDPTTRAYMVALWVPFGYLSLLAPGVLFIAVSEFGLNVLSSFPAQKTIAYQYSAIIVAVSALAMVRGVSRVAARLGRNAPVRRRAVAAACGLALIGTASYQADHYGSIRFWGSEYRESYRVSEHDRLGARFLTQVPPNVAVSAQSDLAPHISNRRTLYVFPTVNDAEYVVLDATSTIFPVHLFPIDGMSPEEAYVEYIRRLLDDGGFQVIDAEDGWFLLKRDVDGRQGSTANEREDILTSIAGYVESQRVP